MRSVHSLEPVPPGSIAIIFLILLCPLEATNNPDGAVKWANKPWIYIRKQNLCACHWLPKKQLGGLFMLGFTYDSAESCQRHCFVLIFLFFACRHWCLSQEF